jgi:endonuclease I
MRQTTLLLLSLLLFLPILNAQIPAGYYATAEGLEGYVLKTALHNIIDNHTVHTYDQLYGGYVTTDTDHYFENDGTVLDVYSENPAGTDPYNWTHGNNQCGNYSNEGDCYNREHIFPQGFFNEASPMKSDIHHVLPTDGKVNGMRGNLPFGEVGSVDWTSLNGSKRGTCNWPGYTGTVFEPIDEFKGDIARCLLYFVTRYEDQLSGFDPSDPNNPLDGSSNQSFEDWHIAMLISWHLQDPVNQREIDRNDAAYDYQNNRNPYIDHPEWVECIWNNNCAGNVDDPSNFNAVGATVSQINLNWTKNTDNDNILLAYNTTNTFGTPSGVYSAGNTISGGGTVLSVGAAVSYNHTGLSSQTYYYKIWSKNATDVYSNGITVSATPLMPECSNHVTNFTTSTPTSSSLNLTWDDATGTVLPSGYLIKANYFGSTIEAPIDGQPEINGLFTKNVAYGSELAVFTGLNQNTNYTFQIFPYTNSGSNINYKTDGSVPQTIGTTLAGSTEIINESFTTCPPVGWTIYSVASNKDWTCSGGLMSINAYNGDVASNDWLISPPVNLDSYQNEMLNFDSWTQYFDDPINNPEVRLKYSTNYSGSGNPEAAVWTEIAYSFPNANTLVWTPSGDLNLNSITGNSVYFAFVYTSSGTGAGTSTLWKIDNVSLSGVMAPAGDDDSQAKSPVLQIPGSSVSSLIDTDTEAVEMFSFDLEDKGTSDGLVTSVLNIRIYPGSSNTADWTDHIQGVLLNGGSISIVSLNITDTYINIQTAPFDIPDGATQTLTLSVWFNTGNLTDGGKLSFKIDADNHGFIADQSFSTFTPVFNSGTDIVSGDFTIDVVGTAMSFVQNASDTEIGMAMNPAPVISLTDENGNLDLNGGQEVLLSSTGTMTGDPLSQINDNGYVEFANLVHTEEGFDLQLHASSGLPEANSALFDAYCYPQPVSGFAVACGSGEAEASWINPDCGDYTIVVVHTAPITGTPEGTYTVHSTDYSDPLNPDFPGGGKVVYSGTSSPQIITGLTNNTPYYFKTMVYHYGFWVTGTEINCTPTGISEVKSLILIRPNPANDRIFIDCSSETMNEITLYDITGKQMLHKNIQGKSVQVNISMLPEGIYVAEFRSGDQIIRQRFVVSHR